MTRINVRATLPCLLADPEMEAPQTSPSESDYPNPPSSLTSLDKSDIQSSPTTVLGLTREHVREEFRCHFHPNDLIVFQCRRHPKRIPPVGLTRPLWDYVQYLSVSQSKIFSCTACSADWWLAVAGDVACGMIWVMLFNFMEGLPMTSPRPVDTTVTVVDWLMFIVFGIWRVHFSPYPFLPFGYQTRCGSEHSHHCLLRLGRKYLHPDILVLLGLLHDKLVSVAHLLAASAAFWVFYAFHHCPANYCACNGRPGHEYLTAQLPSLEQGDLVVRLVRLPDFITTPRLRWLNNMCLAYRDWCRVQIATTTYAELECNGKLLVEPAVQGCLPPIEFELSSLNDRANLLKETDRYLILPWDPSYLLGAYNGQEGIDGMVTALC